MLALGHGKERDELTPKVLQSAPVYHLSHHEQD